jgi:hypothetical protein
LQLSITTSKLINIKSYWLFAMINSCNDFQNFGISGVPNSPPPQGSLEVSSLALPSLKLLSVISWCLTNYQVPEYGSRLVLYVEHDTKVAHLFQRQKLHSEYTKPIRKMTSKFERLNKSILGHTGASTLNDRPQNSLWPFVIFRTQRAIRVRDSKSLFRILLWNWL